MRFSPTNYDPSVDSSPGAPANGNLVLIYPDEFSCRCGCGGKPKNPKRRFIQGHDARLKGMLIRAAITDTQVEVRQGKSKPAAISAVAAAKAFGFGAQVSSAKTRYADAERAAKAKAAEKAKVTAAKRADLDRAKAERAKTKAAAAKTKAVAKRDADRTKAAAKKATKKAPAKKAAAKKATTKAAAPKVTEPEAAAV